MSVGPKQKTTLAEAKRKLSSSEATFDMPRNRLVSSNRSSQPQRAGGPNRGPVSTTFLKSAEEEISPSSHSPARHKLVATRSGSTSRRKTAIQHLDGTCTYSAAGSPTYGTPSTRSSSSDSSSSARSELSSVSSASCSESERSECLSKPITGKASVSGRSSAATFVVHNPTPRANAEPFPPSTKAGEDLVKTRESAKLPATTRPYHLRVPAGTAYRNTSRKSSDVRDLEARHKPGSVSQPKNAATKASKRKPDLDADLWSHKGQLLNAETCSTVTGPCITAETLKMNAHRNKTIYGSPCGQRSPLTTIADDHKLTPSHRSNEQSSSSPTFRAQHSATEDGVGDCSIALSLSQGGVASPTKNRPQESQRKLDVTYDHGSEEMVSKSNRTSASGTAWRNPKTVLRASYKRKTWKRSDGEDRPEHRNLAPEGTLQEHIQKRPGKECLLYPLTVFLVLGFILVGAFLLFPMDPSSHHKARRLTSAICVSPSCRQDALYLRSLLSWDRVEPCDDFHAFVCSRWTSNYFMSMHGTYSVSFDDDYATFLENKVYSLIRNRSTESGSLRLIRSLHDKCMGVIRTDDEGWNPLLELMFDVSLEGFPLTPPVRSSKSVWQVAAKVLRKTGAAALLSVGVAPHPSRTTGLDLLSVSPPEMLTVSDRADTNEVISLYTEAVFSAIKALKKEYLPPFHALSIVKFASGVEQLGQHNMDGLIIPEIDVLKSPSDFLDFFTELLIGVEDMPFSKLESEILVESPTLINGIHSLVHETEAHTVMNFIGVRLMIEVSPFLPYTDMIDMKSTFLYGRRRSGVSRWQFCLRAVEKALVPLVLVSVLEDIKLQESLAVFSDVSRELFQESISEIQASEYLDTASKDAIGSLLSTTLLRVLGPDWINDAAVVERYTSSFPSTGNRTSLASYIANYEHTFLASLKRPSSQRWTRSVFTADCWSALSPPTLYIPLLVFNITRAHSGFPKEYQLMRAAPRVARCIVSMVFDLAAASKNSSDRWLSEQSEIRLLRAESCMNASTGQSSHRFSHVRDLLTTQIAYALFLKKSQGKTQALYLGGERVLSDRQLFFVYLMLQVCEQTAQQNSVRSKAGRHLAAVLRYAQKFSDAYECRLGSPMNAKHKCTLR